MRITARRLALSILMGSALFASSAQAATTTFLFAGSVLSCPETGIPPCGDILFSGDSVGGSFVADTTDLANPNKIEYTDFVNFEIMVGEFFSVNSDNSSLISGGIDLNEAGGVNGGFMTIEANALPGAPTTRISLNFGSNFWAAFVEINGEFVTIANGVGKLTAIPIPGALALFAPALLGLGFLRRRAS